jgi:hypothetical protein
MRGSGCSGCSGCTREALSGLCCTSNDICEPIGGIPGVYVAIGGTKAGVKTEIETVVVQ